VHSSIRSETRKTLRTKSRVLSLEGLCVPPRIRAWRPEKFILRTTENVLLRIVRKNRQILCYAQTLKQNSSLPKKSFQRKHPPTPSTIIHRVASIVCASVADKQRGVYVPAILSDTRPSGETRYRVELVRRLSDRRANAEQPLDQ